MRTPLIAANFKMHKGIGEVRAYARRLRSALVGLPDRDIVVCSAFPSLFVLAEELAGSTIAWGAQNTHWARQGAFTGEVSPDTLMELGCSYVLVGHSERRKFFGDTDRTVSKRLRGALRAGLTPILCVGESLPQHREGRSLAVIERQLRAGLRGVKGGGPVVVAYEPIWAIGGEAAAVPVEVQATHAFIRRQLVPLIGAKAANACRILYGGSVTAKNLASFIREPDIDGALVGGASLDPRSFEAIVQLKLPKQRHPIPNRNGSPHPRPSAPRARAASTMAAGLAAKPAPAGRRR